MAPSKCSQHKGGVYIQKSERVSPVFMFLLRAKKYATIVLTAGKEVHAMNAIIILAIVAPIALRAA